ncbi:MAG: response regulator [Lachnospiraceae bacterium]|nr:response regulator [Lachnospiraceae bacterium]
MEKKLLLISNGKEFMLDAIIKNLKSENFKIVHAVPTVESLDELRNSANLYLFYVSAFREGMREAIVYLRDLCLEHDKKLFLVGDEKWFEPVDSVISEEIVTARFTRPFDMKTLITELKNHVLWDDKNTKLKTILLVDDDGTFLKMVREWLHGRYRIVIVTSGMQAITYLANNTPDLILLDYEMPVTPGPVVMEMIRSEPKTEGIPIVFLTGKGDKDSVMKVLSLKPDGYLLKHLDKEGLISAIDQFFASRKYENI